MRVVFMGTPDFAVGTLKALLSSPEHEVVAVFSQPDKPKGRKKELEPTPVKACAMDAGILVFQPVKIREERWLGVLKELNPDVIVVVAFGQIIPQSILDLPKYGCINVHASLLPAYRGAAPIQWAVIDGVAVSGVTTMRMDAGLDTGDMILKREVAVDVEETGGSLFEKLSDVGAALLLETLTAIENGSATYTPQPKESTTKYASMLKKEDGSLNWTDAAVSLECRIRGLNPWPCAYTRREGKTLKIWRAAVAKAEPSGLAPGTICAVGKKELFMQTGEGVLSLSEVQPEGKKRMSVDAYLRGYPVQVGEIWG